MSVHMLQRKRLTDSLVVIVGLQGGGTAGKAEPQVERLPAAVVQPHNGADTLWYTIDRLT